MLKIKYKNNVEDKIFKLKKNLYLSFFHELLRDHLESSEWLLLAGNPGYHLSDVVKTITKEATLSKQSRHHLSDVVKTITEKKIRLCHIIFFDE